MKPVIILTTTPTKNAAKHIADHLIEQHWAACVNIVQNSESVYIWEGKIQNESEYLLQIKTDKSFIPKIELYFDEVHPYDIPELIVIDIIGGSHKYLDWMSKAVNVSLNA